MAELSRRSPRPRLYSAEPRSSQWPSTAMVGVREVRQDALQCGGILRQRVARVGANIALVVVEEGILHVALEALLDGRLGSGGGGGGGGVGAVTVTVVERVVLPPGPVSRSGCR